MHPATGEFYEAETFWFSFFVPERAIGGWLYTSVRPSAGVSGGGMWIWDASAAEPWRVPFFEQFSHLKLPTETGPGRVAFPTGMAVTTRVPLMAYDLVYDDRNRVRADLTFDAVEPPVALRAGQPPYPRAHHWDQIGRVAGTVVLDGEPIAVDCYGMRDRSWGRRNERGSVRIGYTWLGDAELSLLTYTLPTATTDHIHAGYLRRDGELAYVTSGDRIVDRDPATGYVRGMQVTLTDEAGRSFTASAVALSRLVLPGATSICVNSLLRWTVDGTVVHGEDQEVWPTHEYRARYAGG